jgi:CopG family nickel-responsive transcriptional regulator
MERITISINEELAKEFDLLIAKRGYKNRSEAVRDLVRKHLEAELAQESSEGYCVANLSYVFNHHERDLAERLTVLQHDRHDLTVATMHAHLDHDNCLESVILRGAAASVQEFADAMKAERGVRHGLLNLVTVDVSGGHDHQHGYVLRGAARTHIHMRPKT